jgi:hypothetical protein
MNDHVSGMHARQQGALEQQATADLGHSAAEREQVPADRD